MSAHTFEFSGGSDSGAADERRLEELSSEIKALSASLEAKQNERELIKRRIDAMKEARRIKSEEAPLIASFNAVFQLRFVSCQVDPKANVSISGYIKHSAASRLIEILGPMADGELEAKCSITFHRQEYLEIVFPFTKLESIKRGLALSEGVDLSEHAIRYIAKC